MASGAPPADAPPPAGRHGERGAGRPLVMIGGRDPLERAAGGTAYLRAHARAARQAGFEPHLFCPSPGQGLVETEVGVVHRVRSPLLGLVPPDAAIGFHQNLICWHASLLAADVERFLGPRPGPHLIHGFSVAGCAAVGAARRLQRRGVEAVVVNSFYSPAEDETRARVEGLTLVGRPSHRLGYRAEHLWARHVISRYERQAYTGPRLVAVNYRSVHRLFLARYGPRAEVHRLPYAPESAFGAAPARQRPPLPPALAALEPRDAPLIVSVSRHDPRKGVDVLLHALAELRAAGVRFRACLVSGGPLLSAHRRLAGRLGLAGVTVLTGWVPDPRPYLRHAEIFALPSRQEGSGSLALLEALQAGLAPVASDVDGVPEDVTHGDSALLVPPGDIRALAEALRRVITDPGLRRHFGRRAGQTFADRFSAGAFADALGRTYARLGFVPGP